MLIESYHVFQLGKTIVSEEILENDFVCDLSACKGACCVLGEGGAPLDNEEVAMLEEIYPKVAPFLSASGVEAIECHGTSVIGEDGGLETPLVDGKECAYATFDENGIASCSIEQAYNSGAISWKKPISCHLYPIRMQQYSEFAAVNYHKWQICDPACALGKELKVPIYRFTKEALIRKFGKTWYDELEGVAAKHQKKS